MNAKINDLIGQSYVTTQSQNGREVVYFSQEKFAELIVRECLDILDDEDTGGPESRDVRIAAVRIKELFGVEE